MASSSDMTANDSTRNADTASRTNSVEQSDTATRVDRRTVLAASAALGTGAIVADRATATSPGDSPKPGPHDYHAGESTTIGDGTVTAYATTNPAGKLSSLGVHVDSNAMAAFGDEPVSAHLHFPNPSTSDCVDTHQFTFAGFHYNPQGHPPAGVYDVEHFDFHFYMLPAAIVENIPMEAATYSIPDAQIPTDYVRPPLVDTDDDGEPDAPLVEIEMGEHLLDSTASELQPDGSFTHTNIYGAYDPSGDGVGRLTFVEPMVTTEVLDGLESEQVVGMKTPDAYYVADDYPTTYVMEPDGDGGAFVAVDDFESFPGPG